MKKKLMLAMSGGVDSSAALALLTEKYDVIGGTLVLCEQHADTSDAKRVAERFGIPHCVFDMRTLFREKVMGNFVSTYRNGGTPNPCIQCNKFVKFGALWEEAKKLGCEYFATGHYAKVGFDEASGRYLLLKADTPKDQSYVLYNLPQEVLSHLVLPLGGLDKVQVREIAKKHGLINADKPDSQDICFVPDGDYAKFIVEFTGETPTEGDFTDENGRILGRHRGLIRYTVGQRKGLNISFGKPMYVTGKNAAENRVILGESDGLFTNALTASDVNFISVDTLSSPLPCKAKTRYSQTEQECVVYPLPDGRIRVEFAQPQRAVTSGQSVVLYDGNSVIGGGIIE